MTTDIINIPTIELRWTKWYGWNEFKKSARSTGGILIPEDTGVYKIRYIGNCKFLEIGETNNLRRRIKEDLVKTKGTNPVGKRIRRNERKSDLQIKWAVTDRPYAAKEELLRKYKNQHNEYPKYVKIT